MKPVHVAISALVASTTILATLATLWSRGGDPPEVQLEPDTPAPTTELDVAADIIALRRELALVEERLANEVLELQVDLAAAHEKAPPPATERESGEEAPGEDDLQAQYYEEVQTNLERQLLESRDVAWAPAAEAALADFYSQATEGAEDVRLVSAECRATLCRVEVLGQPGSEVQRLSGRMPWDGNSLFHHRLDVDGSSILVGYISREGSGLPIAPR